MSFFNLIISGIWHHWRMHLAVGLGVATATAVLTGALLVGDSVRGSLSDLTIERLGKIDQVLVADRFFRDEIVNEVQAGVGFSGYFESVQPVILVQGSLRNLSASNLTGNVTVLGCGEEFLKLGDGGPSKAPTGNQIVLNDQLASASELNVQVGDRVMLQIGVGSEVPADSPLGNKQDTIERREFVVSQIIPTAGLGRFGLRPNQQLPNNAFVSRKSLQTMLDVDGKVNCLLVVGKSSDATAEETADEILSKALRPNLADYGLELTDGGPSDSTTYYQLISNRMLLEAPVVAATNEAWADETLQPVLTYLANWMKDGEREIPYSTITAVDSIPVLGPVLDSRGTPIELDDHEIVVNEWAAGKEDLDAKLGDEITIKFFDPETTHGQAIESPAKFQLKAIAPLGGDGQPATAANDRALTPQLKGVTDQDSLDDWEPPFPYDSSRNRRRDEAYWDTYRTTPKSFISLAAGRKLWGSRFGDTTSIRVLPTPENSVKNLASQLEAAIQPDQLGFKFLPVKRLGLRASSGTTPFDALFLGFSMFLIAAALMLVSLLFRLGVEQRAGELGLMSAVGFTRGRAGKVFTAESLLTAIDGAILGVVGGIGYAWLMIVGLRTWWVAAVSTPFMQLHVTWLSLVIGFAIGLLVCWITIVLTVRRLNRIAVRQLLAGQTEDTLQHTRPQSRKSKWIATACIVTAIGLIPVAMQLGGEAQAGAFFGAAALFLIAALVWLSGKLKSAGAKSRRAAPRLGTTWLASRNAARHPTRSTLTIGLVAAASFLIIAISAFQLDESDAGSGGYDLMATSAAPIYFDLSTEDGRFELGIDADTEALLNDATTVAMRVQSGDDASCLNLYQSQQPRVLGVPENMTGDFNWAATSESMENPFELLAKSITPESEKPVVPVIIDMNTAMYSFHLWQGVGETLEIKDEFGDPVTLQVVGLVKNSIFQGDLLIADRDFRKLFSSVSGYQYFLLRSSAGNSQTLQDALEDRLGDYGFDASKTSDKLAGFFAVQNTYLETFQSLGGLGLLLGTFGLAAVQLRNVLSRRSELALLRAMGFPRSRLAWIVMLENALLLCGGLAIGIMTSLVAVLPHFLLGGARIPWEWLATTLAIVLAVGMIAGLAAVRATLRAPVIAALRGE
jgi:ABC-type antimicrobial peptide transport system permease subunit